MWYLFLNCNLERNIKLLSLQYELFFIFSLFVWYFIYHSVFSCLALSQPEILISSFFSGRISASRNPRSYCYPDETLQVQSVYFYSTVQTNPMVRCRRAFNNLHTCNGTECCVRDSQRTERRCFLEICCSNDFAKFEVTENSLWMTWKKGRKEEGKSEGRKEG